MKRIELDCPHPHCKAIIPIRYQEGEEYSGVYWCRCEATRLRVSVKAGEVQIQQVKEAS